MPKSCALVSSTVTRQIRHCPASTAAPTASRTTAATPTTGGRQSSHQPACTRRAGVIASTA